MTSADFSPAPFAVPNAVVPGTTMPDLEYTLYQPQQLKSRVPALMIHGFATRGEQLYGGTSWIRQYLRAGYPVLIVTLPYHSDDYLKDPNPCTPSTASSPTTRACAAAQFRSIQCPLSMLQVSR